MNEIEELCRQVVNFIPDNAPSSSTEFNRPSFAAKTTLLFAADEIARLTAENAELHARLEKAVELPCRVGDKIYDIFENHIREWEVVKILLVKDGYFVQCGHQGTDDYMHVSNKEYGVWWFTDRAKAEAKLKGGDQE